MKRSRSKNVRSPFKREGHTRRPFVEGSLSGKVVYALEPGARAYYYKEYTVIVGKSTQGWHMSIAHPSRYPEWDLVADARYQFIPDDVHMAMLLPPSDQYVNAHPNCFHLWSVEDRRDLGLGIWRV
jgi:hypothetical protein